MVLEWAHLEPSTKDVWKKRAITLGGGGGGPLKQQQQQQQQREGTSFLVGNSISSPTQNLVIYVTEIISNIVDRREMRNLTRLKKLDRLCENCFRPTRGC